MLSDISDDVINLLKIIKKNKDVLWVREGELLKRFGNATWDVQTLGFAQHKLDPDGEDYECLVLTSEGRRFVDSLPKIRLISLSNNFPYFNFNRR